MNEKELYERVVVLRKEVDELLEVVEHEPTEWFLQFAGSADETLLFDVPALLGTETEPPAALPTGALSLPPERAVIGGGR